MTSVAVPIASSHEPTAPPFLLSIDVAAGTVSVHGELDRWHAPRLLDAVAILAHSPAPCWAIDVSGVSFCDAVGLRGLLEAQQLAHRAGRRLRVTRPGPWLCRLLPLIGLTGS